MATKKVTTKQFKDDLEYMIFCYQTVIGDLENTVKMIEEKKQEIPRSVARGFSTSARFLKTIVATYERIGAEFLRQDALKAKGKGKTQAKPSAKKQTTVKATGSSTSRKTSAKKKAK